MYQNKKIVAIIPARAGSKGIPNKNMAIINNKPLIYYTINKALSSKWLDEIVVSTDGEEIAAYAASLGVKVVKRPKNLALDTSKTIECIMHTLDSLARMGQQFDYMLILQPTSPLRTTAQIDGIISWMIDNGFESAVSVSHIPYNALLIRYKNNDNGLINICAEQSTVRRQDMKQTYYVDGSLYLYETNILTLETSLNDAKYGYEIDALSAVDVNTPDDLQTCELLMSASLD